MTLLDANSVRKLSHTYKFGSKNFITDPERFERTRALYQSGEMGTRATQVMNSALAMRDTTASGPYAVWDFSVGHYDDPDANEQLSYRVVGDSGRAYDLALQFMYDPVGNLQSGTDAWNIIRKWTDGNYGFVNIGDSRLMWSNKFSKFIYAASFLKGHPQWPLIEASVASRLEWGRWYTNAWLGTQNRAMWGVVYSMADAVWMEDRRYFLQVIDRWRDIMGSDIVDNELPGEIARGANGLQYCNYFLAPATLAAEIARYNGEWLYDFTSYDGSTFEGVWRNVEKWSTHMETYPYWGMGSGTKLYHAHHPILQSLWPTEDLQIAINGYPNMTGWPHPTTDPTTHQYRDIDAAARVVSLYDGLPLYG